MQNYRKMTDILFVTDTIYRKELMSKKSIRYDTGNIGIADILR